MATQTLTTQNLLTQKAAPPPKPVPQERIRAYKDFLTPALHRRFTVAAATVFVFCLVEAWFLSSTSHVLWSWFPIGSAGLRALLVFIPCLAVFIVRVANMHIGERTPASVADTAFQHLAGAKGIISTLHTFAWYVFSAWFFGEIYIWTRREEAELAMVDPGRAYERPRLNENPIYLRCVFVWVGLLQASAHLVRDYDRVLIPLSKDDEMQEENTVTRTGGRLLEYLPHPAQIVLERIGNVGLTAFNMTLIVNIVNLFTYFILVRHLIWPWTYSTARLLFSLLPEDASPTGIMHFDRMLKQVFLGPFGLIFLWEVSNTVFGASAAQAPLKKEAPLTSEIRDGRGVILHKSKDPNGSLITGLQSKKEVVKTFAFWELFIICKQFDLRRKTIYTEVDRKEGSTWSQVCEASLKEIEAIKQRIDLANRPADHKEKQQANEAQKQTRQDLIAYQPEGNFGLKRIADQNVRNDTDVFAKPKPDFANTFGNMAKSIGQSPNGQNPVSPRARKAIQWSADQLLSPEEQKRYSPEHFQQQAKGYQTKLLQTQLGEPFRQTFARRAISTIFGSPTSNRANIIHATRSLTRLCVSSLKEDDFGQVQKDIARIVRTFTSTIQRIELFIDNLNPHPTDVTFKPQDRKVEQVEQLLAVLKGDLKEIMLAFKEYADTLGLSKKDVRQANEASAAAAKTLPALPPPMDRPEMRQVPPAAAPANERRRRGYN